MTNKRNTKGQSREDSPEQHLKTQKRPGTKVVKPQQPSSAFVMAATSCVTPAGQSSGASTVNGRSEEELLLMDPKKVKRILANRESAARSKERKLALTQALQQQVTGVQEEKDALLAIKQYLETDNAALAGFVDDLTQQVEQLQAKLSKLKTQSTVLIKEIRLAHKVLNMPGEVPEAPLPQTVSPPPLPVLALPPNLAPDVVTAPVSRDTMARAQNPPSAQELAQIERPWRNMLKQAGLLPEPNPSTLPGPTSSTQLARPMSQSASLDDLPMMAMPALHTGLTNFSDSKLTSRSSSGLLSLGSGSSGGGIAPYKAVAGIHSHPAATLVGDNQWLVGQNVCPQTDPSLLQGISAPLPMRINVSKPGPANSVRLSLDRPGDAGQRLGVQATPLYASSNASASMAMVFSPVSDSVISHNQTMAYQPLNAPLYSNH